MQSSEIEGKYTRRYGVWGGCTRLGGRDGWGEVVHETVCGPGVGEQRPQPASEREMTKFHADDYVQFLKMITPQNMHDNIKQLQRCASNVACVTQTAPRCPLWPP